MAHPPYYAPTDGHSGQDQLLTDRAMFTEVYAVIPKGTMRDIVTSALPFQELTRLCILPRPLSGFAEIFSQYIMEMQPGGGIDRPETNPQAKGALFVVEGAVALTLGGKVHQLDTGGYAYFPAGSEWTLHNSTEATALFQWIRTANEAVPGLPAPDPIITNEHRVPPC